MTINQEQSFHLGCTVANEVKKKKAKPKMAEYANHYPDFFLFNDRPVSKEFLQRLGSDLIEFAKTTEEVFRIDWFFMSKQIRSATLHLWRTNHPEFEELYVMAKAIMGMRREQKGLERKFDPNLVALTMPMHDPEWKKMLEWKAKLAKDAADNQTKVIVMEKFTDSDLLEKK